MILRNPQSTTLQPRLPTTSNGLLSRLPDSLPLVELVVLAAIGLGLTLA